MCNRQLLVPEYIRKKAANMENVVILIFYFFFYGCYMSTTKFISKTAAEMLFRKVVVEIK